MKKKSTVAWIFISGIICFAIVFCMFVAWYFVGRDSTKVEQSECQSMSEQDIEFWIMRDIENKKLNKLMSIDGLVDYKVTDLDKNKGKPSINWTFALKSDSTKKYWYGMIDCSRSRIEYSVIN